MDERAAYFSRGRRFAGLPDEAVKDCWAAAFRIAVRSRMPAELQRYADFSAELKLRGIEPTVERVAAATLQAEIRERGPFDPAVMAAIAK